MFFSNGVIITQYHHNVHRSFIMAFMITLANLFAKAKVNHHLTRSLSSNPLLDMTSQVVFKQCIAWPRNPPPRGGLLRGFVTSIGDKTGVLAGISAEFRMIKIKTSQYPLC